MSAVALRSHRCHPSLPDADRPEKLYGCEVWRDLDWMVDADKVPFDLSTHENLQTALLGVFDSQIAVANAMTWQRMGHRKANATYFESHGMDTTQGLLFAHGSDPSRSMMTQLEISSYVQEHIARFAQDVADRLERWADRIG